MIPLTPIHYLLKIGNFTIYTWGAFFVLAFLITSILFFREARKRGIEENTIWSILLLILLGAIIGGRLFFIFENLSYFISKPLEILAFGKGGETSYGGIILSILFVWLYCKKNKDKIRFSQILDTVAPYLALGLAIARIGCFLNWDDFGIASSLPWAIQVAGDILRHPTQLYETLYCLVIFGLLIWFKKIKENPDAKLTKFKKLLNKNGALFLCFLILYSFFRFFNDFLRVYQNYFLGLAESQWILLVTFITSKIILWRKK
ncbi:MAG: prolipoprotein diacylglyceryl transferase [Candidatus Pacearchaeota archaeon]|nr:prolipoprotein diacylglyceryl transferase [Candidatus Pacearchaeota archaeon]